MITETPAAPAAAAEPTVSDLRKMLSGETPAAEAKVETETPAPAKAEKPAPDSDPENSVQDGQERDEAGKFKSNEEQAGINKRIGAALRAQREAERERDELKARLANPGSQPAKEQAQPPAADEEPKAENFETYEKYVKELTRYAVKQDRLATERAASDRKSAETWQTRVAEAKVEHPDFDDVVAAAATYPCSATMHDCIVDSEHGPEIMYHLAQNEPEAARIAKLPPLAAARAMGVLEARLSKPETPVKPAAAAEKPLPRPAKAVGGGHAPQSVDLNDPALDFLVFKREVAKRRAG